MKKVIILIVALALVVLAYGTVKAISRPAEQVAALPATITPEPTQEPTKTVTFTATPARCIITTGLQNGRVNLRACGSLSCGVKSVLIERERLTLLQAGKWAKVQTGAGVTGYVNSNYCK